MRLLRIAGRPMLVELVTTTYSLRQVNQGYQDLRDGRTFGGVIVRVASTSHESQRGR